MLLWEWDVDVIYLPWTGEQLGTEITPHKSQRSPAEVLSPVKICSTSFPHSPQPLGRLTKQGREPEMPNPSQTRMCYWKGVRHHRHFGVLRSCGPSGDSSSFLPTQTQGSGAGKASRERCSASSSRCAQQLEQHQGPSALPSSLQCPPSPRSPKGAHFLHLS